MKRKGLLLILITIFCFHIQVKAQAHYKLYAGFMYHFAKFTQWPSNRQSGDFVIGVIGSKDMAAAAKALSGSKKVGARKIVVKELTSSADAKNCHILFVADSKKGELAKATAIAKANKILLITETPNATSKGSTINFVQAGGKVKFELSKSAAASQGLKISSELQKLAIIKA